MLKSEYVPSEQAREIGDDRGARCVIALDVDPPPPSFSPNDAALASAMVSLSIRNTLADLATRVDSIALSDEPAPAPRGGGPRPPGGPLGPLQGATPPGRPAFPVPVLPNQPRRQRELLAILSGSSASRTRPNRGPQTRSARQRLVTLCCP